MIMAVDDDVIMESPYGAVLSMESFSSRADFNKRINLTLGITEGDRGEGKKTFFLHAKLLTPFSCLDNYFPCQNQVPTS